MALLGDPLGGAARFHHPHEEQIFVDPHQSLSGFLKTVRPE
jgi:hypothetical protein